MSTPSAVKPASYSVVLQRVRAIQKNAAAGQGDKVTDVKDPTQTGTVTPPTHPSEATTNAALPGGNAAGDNAAAPLSLESKSVVGTCEKTESTIDGDAKDKAVTSTTAKLASEASAVLGRVRSLMTPPAKAAGAKAEPSTDSKAKAADPTDKGKVTPSDKAGPEGLPGKGAVATAPDNGAKSAAVEELANDIEFSRDAFVKLAQAVMDAEGGLEYATKLIKRARGAADAEALIANALAAQDRFVAEANAQAEGAEFADALYKSASVEERALMVKMATIHDFEFNRIEARTDLTADEKQTVKYAYAQGAVDAGNMEDTGGELPGGTSDDVGGEDIVAVIEQLVSSGQLPAEIGQQLIAELTGGGASGEAPADGASPAEGAPADAAAAAPAPAGPEGAGAAPAADPAAEEKAAAARITGINPKQASHEQKLAAEILRATLPSTPPAAAKAA